MDTKSSVLILQAPGRRIDQQKMEHAPPLKRCKRIPMIKTHLLLPDGTTCTQQRLCLPVSSSTPLDKHLSSVPAVRKSALELLSSPIRHFSSTSRERILYVGQGELAHATPSQCDVIVSDKATTCHILALRSTCGHNEPLVSLAHVDWDGYEDSIRGMVQEHKDHHNLFPNKKEKIGLDIYIMGGYDDVRGSSRTISDFLIHLLAHLAKGECDSIRMTLRTCAISSMNDGGSRPIGRGMGIDLDTGKAFLAKVDRIVAGPCPELRSARLWAGACDRLAIIHTSSSNDIVIRPFFFRPKRKFVKLLRLPDHQMIERTSTSPTVEEADFCDHVRGTFHFMLRINCFDVFGKQCDTPLTFCRAESLHDWVLAKRGNNNK